MSDFDMGWKGMLRRNWMGLLVAGVALFTTIILWRDGRDWAWTAISTLLLLAIVMYQELVALLKDIIEIQKDSLAVQDDTITMLSQIISDQEQFILLQGGSGGR